MADAPRDRDTKDFWIEHRSSLEEEWLLKDIFKEKPHFWGGWMNEWAFIVTYTEVQAKLQQSTRPYMYRQDRKTGH